MRAKIQCGSRWSMNWTIGCAIFGFFLSSEIDPEKTDSSPPFGSSGAGFRPARFSGSGSNVAFFGRSGSGSPLIMVDDVSVLETAGDDVSATL